MISATQAGYTSFHTLEEMREAHEALLRSFHKYQTGVSLPPDETVATIKLFIVAGCRFGAQIEARNKRQVAQSILDYWAAALYRSSQEEIDSTLSTFDVSLVPELSANACPYVGLAPFTESDSLNFAGRQKLVDAAVAQLQGKNLLLLGASGCGKSSLVYGGILPLLVKQGWQRIAMVPGSDPIANLAGCLTRYFAAKLEASKPVTVEAFYQDPEYLSKTLQDESDIVLVIDQFEEVFTLCHSPEIREVFDEQLSRLQSNTNAQQNGIRTILTLRFDFLPKLSLLRRLSTTYSDQQLNVGPLTDEELRLAIETPAERVGLKIDPRITEDIIEAIRGEAAGLPLLQFTLRTLWDHKSRNRVTWEEYLRIGRPQDALQRAAERVFESFLPQKRNIVERILPLMVALHEDTLEPTSKRIAIKSLLEGPTESKTQIMEVLERLARERLIRIVDGDKPGDEQVEIAHESLARTWKRFGGWLESKREVAKRRRLLTDTANQWSQSSRNSDLLYRGSQLEESRRLVDLSESERAFLNASKKAQDDVSRQSFRRRVAAFTVLILLVVALAFALIMLVQQNQQLREATLGIQQANGALVERNRQLGFLNATSEVRGEQLATAAAENEILRSTAQAEAERAVASEAEAQDSKATAEAGQAKANIARATTEATNLELKRLSDEVRSQAIASLAIDTIGTDPERAVLLAVNANAVARTFAASDALRRSVAESKIRSVISSPQGELYDVNLSPDKRVAFSWSLNEDRSSTLRLWDVGSGSSITSVNFVTRVTATGATFSPDGGQLVVSLYYAPSLVIDTHTGQVLTRLNEGQPIYAYNVFYSPDTNFIIAPSAEGIYILDSRTYKRTRLIEGFPDQVLSASISPDGSRVVGGSNNVAMVYDLVANQIVGTLSPFNKFVDYVQYSSDGNRIITIDRDKKTQLWDANTFKKIADLTHLRDVFSARFSPDATVIITTGGVDAPRIWDAKTGRRITTLNQSASGVYFAEYSRDGAKIITSSSDNTARIWDARTNEELFSLRGHTNIVSIAHFSRDGSQAITASLDETIRVWNVLVEGELGVLRGHLSRVYAARYSPNGKVIVTVGLDRMIRAWDRASFKLLYQTPPQGDSVNDVAIKPDGSKMVTVGSDRAIKIWEVATGRELRQLSGHSNEIFSADFSSDGHLLVTGSWDRTAIVWETESWTQRVVLRGHTDNILSARFSNDGRFIVTASSDKTARVWDARSGSQLLILKLSEPLYGARFSPDGSQIVTVGVDQVATVWSLRDQKIVRELRGHTGYVNDASYTPDGHHIVTSGEDGTARIWNSSTGRLESVLRGHTDHVWSIDISQDGTRLLTASWDGTVRQYVIAIDDLLALAKARVTRGLTCKEKVDFLGELLSCD